MCLYVDDSLTGLDSRGRVKRRRAVCDILVYKILHYSGYDGSYNSPYMGTRWELGVPQKSIIKVYRDEWDDDMGVVEEGLHSFISPVVAQSRGIAGTRLPAIIPKGSKVIFGEDDEVVSDTLIVYKDLESLVKARGAIGPGIPREKIANYRKR